MSANISGLNLEGYELYRQPAKERVGSQRFHALSVDAISESNKVSKTVSNPIQSIKNAFERLQYFYHTNVSLAARRRISQVFRGIGKLGSFLGSAYEVFDPILDIFRTSVEYGDNKWGIGDGVFKRIKQTKVLSFVGVFISLKGIGEGIFDIPHFLKNKLTIIVDKVLEILENIGSLFSSIETLTDGLLACQIFKASEGLSSVMNCFAAIGTVFGLATVMLNIKNLFENRRLTSKLDKLFGGKDQLNMKAFAIKIRKMDDETVVKKFGIADGAAFKARIHAIYAKTKNSLSDKSKRELASTMNALKTRLSSIDANLKLKIIAAAAGIIASAIFMGIAGALAGHILLAAASAIGIATLLIEYKGERDLNAKLEKIAPDHCQEMRLFFQRKEFKEKMKWDPAYNGIRFKKQL